MGGAVEEPGWSDELAAVWSVKAAESLRARAIYSGCFVCEIVLEGACPRCGHPMVSTHPARGVTPPEARSEPPDADQFRRRLLVLRCNCAHAHEGCPGDMRGCGAVFAVWVAWADSEGPGTPPSRMSEPAAGPTPTLLALEQEQALQSIRANELADVRKAAENWRTGLGALLAILVAVLFIEGKQSLDEISSTLVQVLLAALLLTSAFAALYGAYRAVRAANGIPSDEYAGNDDSALMRLVDKGKDKLPKGWFRTPDDPAEYETVGAWRHAFVQLAVNDLRHAKVATIASLLMFAVAVLITWVAS